VKREVFIISYMTYRLTGCGAGDGEGGRLSGFQSSPSDSHGSIRRRNMLTFHKALKRSMNNILKVCSYLQEHNLLLYYKDQ
jgi:hypothetical protein